MRRFSFSILADLDFLGRKSESDIALLGRDAESLAADTETVLGRYEQG